jgi:O-antigen/teichoic acid export membrane protein
VSADGKRSLVGASVSLITGRIAVAILSYGATAAIARTLSGDDWGAFTFVFSVTTLLSSIFDLQASRLVLKELLDPNADAGRTVSSYMTLRLALGSVAYAVAMAFVILAGYPSGVVEATAVGGMFLLLSPTWNALFIFFQANHWLRSVAVVNALSRVVLLAVALGLVVTGTGTLVGFVWTFVIAEVFIFCALIGIASRHIRLRPRVEPRKWWLWLQETIPIVLGSAIGTVYFRIDAVMLAQMDDLNAVGLYGIAYKFSDLLGYVPHAVMAAAFTLLVGAWPERPHVFWRNFRGALLLLVLGAVVLTAEFCAFAGPLIETLYGTRYLPAENAARLVVAGQAVRFFTVLCTLTLISVRRNVTYAIASIVGCVINVGLNLVLIPRYSFRGAAFATLATEVIVLSILAFAVGRIPHAERFPWPPVLRMTVAASTIVVLGFTLQAIIPWPIAAAISGLAGVAVLHVLGIDGPGGLRVIPSMLEHVENTEELPAAGVMT